MSEKGTLLLIAGIPGTGKTYIGESLAGQFDFIHYDLEHAETFQRFCSNPALFIENIMRKRGRIVLTWGFVPNEQQIAIVNGMKAKGFSLIWFDGNRPAALREFIKRRTVPETAFYAQMYRIEDSKVIEQIDPIIIDTFDENGKFKAPKTVFQEIKSKIEE